MKKPTARMLEALNLLSKPGAHAVYMPYMGRFNEHPYYFFHDSWLHCTAVIRGLLSRGLVEKFDKDDWRDNHKVRISALGRKYLKDYRP